MDLWLQGRRHDHMADPYHELAKALSSDGIRCRPQARGQLVVSSQWGPSWPDRGNSFWITHAGGRWHLFTWAPRGYRVPRTADVTALCRTCMAHGTSAMFKVPPHIVETFGLVELTDE